MILRVRIPSSHEVREVGWRHHHKQSFRRLIQASEAILIQLKRGHERPFHSSKWIHQLLDELVEYERLCQRLCTKLFTRRAEWCVKMLEMDQSLHDLIVQIRQYGAGLDRWKVRPPLPKRSSDDFMIDYRRSYDW